MGVLMFPLFPLAIFIFLPFSSLLGRVNGQYYLCYDQDGNFTSDETYGRTLDSLLGLISKTSSDNLKYGLLNVSASQPQYPDDIQVLGVCSGDSTGNPCLDCLGGAADQVRRLCPTKKQATLFKDKCWIRYSNSQLFGELKTDPYIMIWSLQNASNWDRFLPELKKFMDNLGDQAASGGSFQKYAASNSWLDLYNLYGTVQCSPDLSYQSCSDCATTSLGHLPIGRVGAAVLTPSCQIRYQTDRIFNIDSDSAPPPQPSPPPPSPPPPTGNHIPKTWVIVGASGGTAVVVISVLIIAERKMHPRNRSKTESVNIDIVTAESLQFDLDIIKAATENFSEDNKFGRGGFGSVFRGTLPSGQEIAVKRLSQNSGQGEFEFKNEARLLSRLQHRNLVRLLGYCLEGIERLLVYEFVPNASLDKFIFDPLKRTLLDWDTRYKIITGITRGLLYLHEDSRLRIIHRDLKASNILLDMDMNPKISDFGMARLFELDQNQADTNRIMGTYGYMAPEYASRGNFSVKSDVFSFGVLVLEIISGRRNLVRVSGEDSMMLIGHAWTKWREGNISDIVDPAVSSGYSANILRCMHIGLLCVQETAADRPEMASVIRWFDHHSVALPVPTQPAFFTTTSSSENIPSKHGSTSGTTEANHSKNNAGTSSINIASITEPYPR